MGDAGQARLACAVVRVAGEGLAAEVEARYLRGAGMRVVTDGAATEPGTAPWILSLAPGAREVAAGAHAALEAVRAVLSRGDESGRRQG